MPGIDFESRVDGIIRSIEASSDIHPDTKEQLQNFKRDRVIDGISHATLQKDLSHLKVLTEHLGPDTAIETLDKPGIKDLLGWIHQRDIADATIAHYKKIIRIYLKWLNDGTVPPRADWIKPNNTHRKDPLPKELLTPTDIHDLIDEASNPRDETLISLLWETGARIGELLELTVGDIEDREHGKKIVVDGKTGARRLPLVESAPHINRWLNRHPKPDKDAPLWCKIRNGEEGITYNYIRQKILQRLAEKAGIDKPVNPHHFRHSRATHLANEFTEAQLCSWFGWVQGSDRPQTYVHLSGRDIDNAYDNLHGIQNTDTNTEDTSFTRCPRCEELNQTTAQYCMKCGQELPDTNTTDENGEPGPEQELRDLLREHPDLARKLGKAAEGAE